MFIMIVCNSDMYRLTKRTENLTLTWFEEWFVFFEKIWGRTLSRWVDSSDSNDGYGIRKETLIAIFDDKLKMVLQCRESWPAFLSFDEDKKYCDESSSMKKKYEGLRPIFWDITGIHMNKPSDAQMQRLTYSSYYSCNCFKGGIGLQLGGCIRTHDLWTGCVSDTAYQGESDIFPIQKAFCELDLVGANVVPFTNVFDKGYRNRLQACWLAGNQLTLQPVFAKSDEKFRRNDTLSSAVIEADRSSNEH